MEMRVGSWVMVTARVIDQKASRVMTAAAGRARAEEAGRERGAVMSLLGIRTKTGEISKTEF